MNFQVTVLKILVSYPGGFAAMEDLKRDMAILATSGRDWGGPDQAAGRTRAGPRPILAEARRARSGRLEGYGQGTGCVGVYGGAPTAVRAGTGSSGPRRC